MEQEPDRLYARTWRLRVDTVPQQEAIQMMLDVLLPEVSSLPGYRGATLLMDRTTSELNATVYWASLADLSASQVRETNAATGAFVLADGSQLEAAVHEVVLVDPAPALVNRSLGSQ